MAPAPAPAPATEPDAPAEAPAAERRARLRIGDLVRLFRDVRRDRSIFLRDEYDRLWPALRRLARWYRRRALRRTHVVVVVGSLGKTTTTRAVAAALGVRERRLSYSNYGASLAANLLCVSPFARRAVLEAGVNGPGPMAAYGSMLRPTVVVVTSIKSEHNRSFPTLLDTRAEKVKMVRALPPDGVAILNGDDPHVRWMATQTAARVVTFGLGPDNDVRAAAIRADGDGAVLDVHVDGVTHVVRSGLVGDHMAYPLLAALAAAHVEGLDLAAAAGRLAAVPAPPARMEIIALADGTRILDDSYKAPLESVHAALDAFAALPASGRKVVVLGNVQEPPGRAGDIYRDLGERLGRFADLVIAIGGNSMETARASAARAGLDRANFVLAGTRIGPALEALDALRRPGDLVLIKGASAQKLRRVTLHLRGRAVACRIKYCNVKVRSCDACPLVDAPASAFASPLVRRYVDP